jgi:hypothetical protein
MKILAGIEFAAKTQIKLVAKADCGRKREVDVVSL